MMMIIYPNYKTEGLNRLYFPLNVNYTIPLQDGKCRFAATNVGANDTGFVDVASKDENALQSAVANVGPISVAIDASHITFQVSVSVQYCQDLLKLKLSHIQGNNRKEIKHVWPLQL